MGVVLQGVDLNDGQFFVGIAKRYDIDVFWTNLAIITHAIIWTKQSLPMFLRFIDHLGWSPTANHWSNDAMFAMYRSSSSRGEF